MARAKTDACPSSSLGLPMDECRIVSSALDFVVLSISELLAVSTPRPQVLPDSAGASCELRPSFEHLMPELPMPPAVGRTDEPPPRPSPGSKPRQMPQHISGHLRASAAVGALLQDLQRREALLRQVQRALPEALARHCIHASLDEGNLSLVVDSPVWVDRLRFLVPQLIANLDPRLAAGLAERSTDPIQGWRVRARPLPRLDIDEVEPRWYRGSTGPEAISAVESAAAALGTTPLADSLRRLAKTLQGQGCETPLATSAGPSAVGIPDRFSSPGPIARSESALARGRRS